MHRKNRKIKKAVVAAVCLLVSVFSFNCKNGNTETKQIKPLAFNIDSSLIGSEISFPAIGISFNPPAKLKHSDDFFEKVTQKYNQTQNAANEFSAKPLEVFTDPDLNILIISSTALDNQNPPDDYLEKITSSLKTQFKNDKPKFNQYLKNGIKINQFIIQDSVNVVFKLLFATPNNNIIQFDYVIQQSSYRDEIKGVESSIGTIRYSKK